MLKAQESRAGPEPGNEALGTVELESGMHPGRAADVLRIGLIAVAMLLVFNAGGLAKWAQNLPSSATNAWLADLAGAWHDLMQRLGPAEFFDWLRERFKID